MPQLDKITFFTQYFWLTVFFFILYFLLVNLFVYTIFVIGKIYRHVNQSWMTFTVNFNLLVFDKLMSERYSWYVLNNSNISLMYCIGLTKFNFLGKLLQK